MNKTALALFRTQTQVDDALLELHQHGFSESHMKSFSKIGASQDDLHIATINPNEDDRISDMKSSLYKALREWDIPQDDSLLFTEGVRSGGKLAVVFTDESKMNLVIEVLKHHGALDLNARKRFAEEERQRPAEGLNASPFTNIEQQQPKFTRDFAEWLLAHRDEVGPRSAVKVYEILSKPEDISLDRNLNE